MVDKTTHICIFFCIRNIYLLVNTKSENFSSEWIARVIEAFMQINEYRLGEILVAGESITSDSERPNIKHARGEIDDVLLRCL